MMEDFQPMSNLGTPCELNDSALEGSATLSVGLVNGTVRRAGQKLGVKQAEKFFIFEVEGPVPSHSIG